MRRRLKLLATKAVTLATGSLLKSNWTLLLGSRASVLRAEGREAAGAVAAGAVDGGTSCAEALETTNARSSAKAARRGIPGLRHDFFNGGTSRVMAGNDS